MTMSKTGSTKQGPAANADAAESLVAERFMLAGEVESVVKKAAADYC